MPKQKTHRASAKRFELTKTGKIKRARAYKNHILNKKDRKRKRNLRKGALVDSTQVKNVRLMIPYK
ncbi:MAG: 50S ribosomal protein L35 [Clostridia bacterium]|nr:50S ribosomal protein L35 [Clostridia bacterium]